MAHAREPKLRLLFAKVFHGEKRFTFALENPDNVSVGQQVKAPELNFEGQAWNFVCKRQPSKGAFVVDLVWLNKYNEPRLKCLLDFTIKILRRTPPGSPESARKFSVAGHEFSTLEEPQRLTVSFKDLINPKEGFFSVTNQWVELELFMSNCVSIFEERKVGIGGNKNSLATFRFAGCEMSLRFDNESPRKSKPRVPAKRIIRLTGRSHSSRSSNNEYSLKLSCFVDDFVSENMSLRAKKKSQSAYRKDGTPYGLSLPEGHSIKKVRIEIRSFVFATTIFLKQGNQAELMTSFQDHLGDRDNWGLYTQKEEGCISVKLHFLGSHPQDQVKGDSEAVALQWRAWFVSRKSKVPSRELNEDGSEFSAVFYTEPSCLTEYTMKSSLQKTKVSNTSAYCRLRNGTLCLSVLIEYVNLQPNIFVPKARFMMDSERTNMNLSYRMEKLEQENSTIRQKNATILQEKTDIRQELLDCRIICEQRLAQKDERIEHLQLEVEKLTSEAFKLDDGESPRITVENGQETAQIPGSEVQRPGTSVPKGPGSFVTEKQMRKISRNMGTEWRELATDLGIERTTVSQIVSDNKGDVCEQIFDMLYKWKCSSRSGATVQTLFKALKDVNADMKAIDVLT